MNSKQKQAFRYAIRKVRQFVGVKELTRNRKEHQIIKAFLDYNNIEFNGYRKEIKPFLANLYIEKHQSLDFTYKKRNKTAKTKTYKNFYDTPEWQRLRKMVLKCYGLKCMKCAARNTELHVDHIRPISKHPHLKLCFGNLQVLCKRCNKEKSNVNENDYRPFVKENFLYNLAK